MSRSKTASSTAAVVGDVANMATMVSVLAFALAVGMYGRGKEEDNGGFFDSQWKREGFCVAGWDKPYLNSHDVCLYTDIALSGVLAVLYLFLRKTPGLERPNGRIMPNVLGILGHGIGHGFIGYSWRNFDGDVDQLVEQMGDRAVTDRFRADSGLVILREEAVFFLFWIGLIYATTPRSKISLITVLSLLARTGQWFMPTHFAFTYVQTVLYLVLSLDLASLPMDEKDFSYALYGLLVGLPVSIAGWIESTQCTAWVQKFAYGHVLYDATIALSMIAWYLLCYFKVKRSSKIKTQ